LIAAWALGADSSSDYVFEYVDAYVFAAEWAEAVPVSYLFGGQLPFSCQPAPESLKQGRQGINLHTWLSHLEQRGRCKLRKYL